MTEQALKTRVLAVIREAECIGCTKCIQACPVDAILGSSRQLHTVIADECIGCKLCLPPCPVDCIDLIPAALNLKETPEARKEKAAHIKKRYAARRSRLQLSDEQEELSITALFSTEAALEERKNYVETALLRAKLKKKLQARS